MKFWVQRHRTPLILLVLLMLAAVVIGYLVLSRSTTLGEELPESYTPTKTEVPPEDAEDHSQNEAELPIQEDGLSRFPPERIFGNVNCRMLIGNKSASGIGLVVLPRENESEFAVFGPDGLVFGGSVPFKAHSFDLGRRADGGVLVGLADLRLNSGVFRPSETDEPLRIYLDGHVIYETRKARDFNIASMGTSFVVHEPTSGGASRLLIRDIDHGTEERVDRPYTRTNDYDPGVSLGYSLDETEVVLVSSGEDSRGRGRYWFYSIKDGISRNVTVDSGLSVILTSSENGFFVERPLDIEEDQRGDVWQISRRKIRENESLNKDVWTKRLSLGTYSGSMKLSGDGRWLALNGWKFKVLNAETGETVFDFPKAGDKQSRLARESSVLGPGASVDDLGRIGYVRFVENKLLILQQYGSRSPCTATRGGEWDREAFLDCVERRRALGLYRTVADIYDMGNIKMDSKPDFRIETDRRGGCFKHSPLFGGLEERDGELVFLPGTLSE